ncbi:hypothetical protein BMS3Abin09_01211 [bacterium BMS3Abin09]|nr:hypothetical protein BMS3Abin09_01211 [bacterium BMS3Abin09]HDH34398.1 hypothetical protein [Nitrospirota bacterium]HDN95299.1 hypothetical protein [Nitrospirota bacterium]HDO67685.1 hypothetical protein [Nitrospirota bacterium]HEW81859.1 hypothetical protein [Nitrospirota bacterium]
MESIEHHLEPCTICNDVYTPMHTEIRPGVHIYICEDCVEAARYNFIWLCLHCGRAYFHLKNITINDETPVIQAIDMCEKCDANGTERYMKLEITNIEC